MGPVYSIGVGPFYVVKATEPAACVSYRDEAVLRVIGERVEAVGGLVADRVVGRRSISTSDLRLRSRPRKPSSPPFSRWSV